MLITRLVATLEDGRQYSVEAMNGDSYEPMARLLQGVVERKTGVNRTAALIAEVEAALAVARATQAK